MPLQFASAGVERYQRIGVEVGPRASVGQEIGRRIGHGNVNDPGLRVERERRPDRASAALPHVSISPRLGAWLAVIRNSVESPDRLAGFEFERAYPAFDALFADSESEQDQILEDHRRHVERSFVLLGGDDLSLPQRFASLDVEREEITVHGYPDDSPIFDGGAAIRWIDLDGLQLPIMTPLHPTI